MPTSERPNYLLKQSEIMRNDEPLEVIIEKMNNLIKEGGVAFIKFTCQNCGSRQTSDEPNTVHLLGYTCEECGEASHPEKFGLMVMMGVDLPTVKGWVSEIK